MASPDRTLPPWNRASVWRTSKAGTPKWDYMPKLFWRYWWGGNDDDGHPGGSGCWKPEEDGVNVGYAGNASGATSLKYSLPDRVANELGGDVADNLRAWKAGELGLAPQKNSADVFGVLTYGVANNDTQCLLGPSATNPCGSFKNVGDINWENVDGMDYPTFTPLDGVKGVKRDPVTWERLGDNKIECPKGECQYAYHASDCSDKKFKEDTIYKAVFANKIKWDSTYAPQCCLGVLTGDSQTLLCDPQWNDNNCCESIIGTCTEVVDGKSLLATDNHPCNVWYQRTRAGPILGSNQWNCADRMIEKICQENPDAKECECYAKTSCLDGCIPYASISGIDNKVFSVTVYQADGGNPINVAQPLCLETNCKNGGSGVLVTSSMQQIFDRCPIVCHQTNEDEEVNIGSLGKGKGFYVDDDSMNCNVPTRPKGVGILSMNPTFRVPLVVSGDGTVESWDPLLKIGISLANQAVAGSADVSVDVKVSGLLSGLTFSYANTTDPTSKDQWLEIPPQQAGYVTFAAPDMSKLPKLPPGKNVVMTVQATDRNTKLLKATTQVILSPVQGQFAPSVPFCDKVSCGKNSQIVNRVTTPSWVAYLLVLLSLVFLSYSSSVFYEAWQSSPPTAPALSGTIK